MLGIDCAHKMEIFRFLGFQYTHGSAMSRAGFAFCPRGGRGRPWPFSRLKNHHQQKELQFTQEASLKCIWQVCIPLTAKSLLCALSPSPPQRSLPPSMTYMEPRRIVVCRDRSTHCTPRKMRKTISNTSPVAIADQMYTWHKNVNR